MLCVEETFLYKVILSIIMNVLVFARNRASNLDEIIKRSAILVIFSLDSVKRIYVLLT